MLIFNLEAIRHFHSKIAVFSQKDFAPTGHRLLLWLDFPTLHSLLGCANYQGMEEF